MIVLLHGARAFGAVERYVADIASALRDGDEEAVLLHPDDAALAPFHELAGGRLRVEALPRAALVGGGIRPLRELRRVLCRLRPRLVHLTDVWPVATIAARLAHVPRILVTHHTPELRREDSAVGRLWWRLSWWAGPEVIYTSDSDRRLDARGRLRSHVVYLGIDLDRFRSADRALPPNGPVIGNVARLSEQKGQRFLVDALPRIAERHPGARVALVGDGPLRAALERQAASLGVAEHVVFAGQRHDVPRWLASFDVFALPSLFEGLCYAVIEAQAAGVPVVATPVGGVRDTVVDGETGILVPAEDSAALADAIVRLLDDPAEARRLATEAARRATRFSRDRMVRETIALYGPPV